QRPIIEGAGAVTAPGLVFWNESRGVIKVGGASKPVDTMPRYIVIQGLEVRRARTSHKFTNASGGQSSYAANAAVLYVEKCENCTFRNNVLSDSGNIIFISRDSRSIIIEQNSIFKGGNFGSSHEHNVYSEALGIQYEGNYLGPLLAGAAGTNLKDRSAGTVVRYNWIEGGNRQLDLVDSSFARIIADPSYRSAFVYGNILIERINDGNSQVLHYGGDSGNLARYRKGVLYFYNNTVISRRSDNTTLFRLSSSGETVDARNNIVWVEATGSRLALIDKTGTLLLSRNWLKTGYRTSHSGFTGSLIDDGTSTTGSTPGFVDENGNDFHLIQSSPAINAGGNPDPAVMPAHAVTRQYKAPQNTEPRPSDGVWDIGGFEYAWSQGGSGGGGGSSTNLPPVALISVNPVSGVVPLAVSVSGASSYDPDGTVQSWSWSFGDGGSLQAISGWHTYNAVGTFTALLRVTDDKGATSSVTGTVTVTGLPAPVLTGMVVGSTVQLNWTDPSGGKAAGFRLEMKTPTTEMSVVGNFTTLSYSATRPKGTYVFRVRSSNPYSTSPYSNIVTLVVP
ncbi:MAG: PKD domain-containing protein, partial [Bryobacteraceae bacterium]